MLTLSPLVRLFPDFLATLRCLPFFPHLSAAGNMPPELAALGKGVADEDAQRAATSTKLDVFLLAFVILQMLLGKQVIDAILDAHNYQPGPAMEAASPKKQAAEEARLMLLYLENVIQFWRSLKPDNALFRGMPPQLVTLLLGMTHHEPEQRLDLETVLACPLLAPTLQAVRQKLETYGPAMIQEHERALAVAKVILAPEAQGSQPSSSCSSCGASPAGYCCCSQQPRRPGSNSSSSSSNIINSSSQEQAGCWQHQQQQQQQQPSQHAAQSLATELSEGQWQRCRCQMQLQTLPAGHQQQHQQQQRL